MNVLLVGPENKEKWNQFVTSHFPIVGGFLESWEWGTFKASLGYPTYRYVIEDDGMWQGLFTLEEHRLPFGFKYGYLPRGPLIPLLAKGDPRGWHILSAIESFFRDQKRNYVFVRFEPPIEHFPKALASGSFERLMFYVQPRFNTVIDLAPNEENIVASFSRDIRQDVRAAERRDIRVEAKRTLTPEDWAAFKLMQQDTSARAGKNVYPDENYFMSLYDHVSPLPGGDTPNQSPGLITFFAYYENVPVAANLVLFLGKTATYLFGASRTGKISGKASSYLHFAAMREAKRYGYEWYDIGGIDDMRWPTLTYFKKQFNGKTVAYAGNTDFILRRFSYWFYRIISGMRRRKR